MLIKIWCYLRLARALFRLQKNPENTELVFDVSDRLHQLGAMREMEKILAADPASAQIIKDRVLLEGYSLQSLAQLPVGTLGKVYADHMLANKLDPEFYRRPKHITNQSYAALRMRQTHDLWHVVTGFETSVRGEISLQSFMLAQQAAPLSMMLVSTTILRTAFKNQENIFPAMDGIVEGWLMGRKARLLFPYDWKASWGKSLQVVRQELNLTPAAADFVKGR